MLIKPKFELGEMVNLRKGFCVAMDFEFNPYKIISISLNEETDSIFYCVRPVNSVYSIVSMYDEFVLEKLNIYN